MSAGPKAATRATSATIAAITPSNAERQPRVWPTAKTIVRASTISTAHAKNTAPTRTITPEETVVANIYISSVLGSMAQHEAGSSVTFMLTPRSKRCFE